MDRAPLFIRIRLHRYIYGEGDVRPLAPPAPPPPPPPPPHAGPTDAVPRFELPFKTRTVVTQVRCARAHVATSSWMASARSLFVSRFAFDLDAGSAACGVFDFYHKYKVYCFLVC